MPLIDSPVLDRLSIPVQVPAPDTFLLGSSLLGSGDALGDGTGPGYLVLNIMDHAVQSVTVDRGVEPNYLNPRPIVGTMTIILKNPAYVPEMGQELQLIYTNTDATPGGDYMFTGRVSDVYTRLDPVEKDRVVTITVLDRVATIANTSRYGSIVEGRLLVEHTRERMVRLLAGVPGAQVVGHTYGPTIKMTNYNITSTYKADATWVKTGIIDYYTGAAFDFDRDSSMTAQVTGLVPGNYYQFSLEATLENPSDARLYLNNRLIDWQYSNGFIADQATATIRIEARGMVTVTYATLGRRNTTYPADLHTSTVHESTLANHLDQIVSGTQYWGWYVDGQGRPVANALARNATTASRAGFQRLTLQSPLVSNVATNVEFMSDVFIAQTFDDLVNEIDFESHQIQWDDEGNRAANDVTLLGSESTTSKNKFGSRLETLETQLGDQWYANQLAQQLLTRTSSRPRIQAFTLSGQQNRPAGPGLTAGIARIGPFDQVNPPRDDLPQGTMLVAGVRHVITPTRWLCHVTTLPQG